MPWSEWIKEPVCWLVCYLIIANLAGFAMMGIDKYKAKHERWRIRERTLMLTAALGGSAGCGYSTTRRCTSCSAGACRPLWRYRRRWPCILSGSGKRNKRSRKTAASLRRFFCACDNCVIEVRERLMC